MDLSILKSQLNNSYHFFNREIYLLRQKIKKSENKKIFQTN